MYLNLMQILDRVDGKHNYRSGLAFEQVNLIFAYCQQASDVSALPLRVLQVTSL
jgi:hypothetical protein